jgi:hypothetical protein
VLSTSLPVSVFPASRCAKSHYTNVASVQTALCQLADSGCRLLCSVFHTIIEAQDELFGAGLHLHALVDVHVTLFPLFNA